MNKLSNKELRELVENTKGRIMKVRFIKKDNTERTMICRTDVRKCLTGTGRTWSKENIITVYDMVKHDYRNINLDTLREIRCGKIEYKAED